MSSLISVSGKYMEIKPNELVNLINKSEYTKGLEIYIDMSDDNPYGLSVNEELDYLDKLVFELKKNNLIMQIHGEIELDMDKQLNYLKKLENYSDYLGYPIVVTMHTKLEEDQDKALNDTKNYIEELLTHIDSNKIIICVENLNDMYGIDRLEKELIEPLVLNNEKVFFTYDIGHVIIDFDDFTNLDKYMIDKIKNVHLHSFDLAIRDHMPIYKNDKYWNTIIKAVTYLKTIHYKYNVVFEYDLYRCYGDTIKEKIEDYLKSIDLVSEHLY